jgi:hypothetical protein
MKATLIKENDFYYLFNDKKIIAEIDGHPLKSITGKLSKQNCDEIFGVIDVDKLAKDFSNDSATCDYEEGINVGKYQGYLEGFNKAMELNKDKRFTLGDMKRVFNCGRDLESIDRFEDWRTFTHFINSLEPTEIEVEIEMETKKQLVNGYKNQPDNVIGFVAEYENILVPKLDSEGCLILKSVKQ